MGEILQYLGRALQTIQINNVDTGRWSALAEVTMARAAIEREEQISHPADVIWQSRGLLSSNLAELCFCLIDNKVR